MKEALKNVKWQSLVSSIIYIVIGLFLVIYPNQVADIICNLIGAGLIIYGAILLIGYFVRNVRDILYRDDFVLGIIWILIGILVISQKDIVKAIIPFLLGIFIVASGFMKLQDAVDAKRMGSSKSLSYLVMAVISIVLGLIILFNLIKTNEMLYRFIGIGLLYSGVSDLYFTLKLSAKINQFVKQTKKEADVLNGNVMDSETGRPLHEREEEGNIPVHEESSAVDAEVVDRKEDK